MISSGGTARASPACRCASGSSIRSVPPSRSASNRNTDSGGPSWPSALAARAEVSWNGMRPAVLAQRDQLTVQHRRLDRQRAQRGHHLRDPAGDLVQGAGEQPDLAAGHVRLDPDPVQLPLHRRRAARADLGQRLADARRAGRQHRPDRPADLQAERAQRLAPARHRRGRHRAQRAAQHHGPAHVRHRHLGRPGHRVGHHAFQRSLAQLAGQQPDQEPLLGLGGPAEQLADQGPPRRRRALSGYRADGRQRRVHLAQRQARACPRAAKPSRSDAQPTPICRCGSSPDR